jgi:hypothetical protein
MGMMKYTTLDFSAASATVFALVTIGCSIDPNATVCGPPGWATVFIGGNTAKVINDTLATAGAAAAIVCAATADPFACGFALGDAIYAGANALFGTLWDAFGPAQFTGSLLPRPADLSGLGTSSIGIPNQNLSINDLLGQSSLGTVPSPGMKLP